MQWIPNKNKKNGTLCYDCTHHETVVSPAAEFHFTLLIVERKPGDIDFTSALENARWNVGATAIVSNDDVGLECVVKSFVSAVFIPPQIEEELEVQQQKVKKLK